MYLYNEKMFTDVIIMAGGSGTRLWPASNTKTPKQFLSIGDASSFFGAALNRAFAVIGNGGTGRVVIVVGPAHVGHVIRACATLDQERKSRVVVIAEPSARNTAPALACAAKYLRLVHGTGRRALMLTSDHLISPLDAFLSDAEAADGLAARERLVVFGIRPRGPETGYGYIEAAESADSASAPERSFAVASFREKPDRETAERFLSTGRFFWNSGMFGFDVDFVLDEFRANAGDVVAPFDALAAPSPQATEKRDGVPVITAWEGLAEAYAAARSVSIDYAIAEKCRRASVVVGSFDWLDIGSWDEYANLVGREAERSGTVDRQPVFAAASTGCFVDSDLPVALCGVEDLIVVVRSGADGGPPAVLVCKRGESQGMRSIVDKIKGSGRIDLL